MIVQKVLKSYKRKTRETSRGPGRMGLQTVCQRSTLLLRITISNQKNLQAPSSGI